MIVPISALAWLMTLLLLPAALSGCSQPSSAQAPALSTAAPASVKTAQVATRSLPRTLTLTGTLIANQESDVAADAAGKIALIAIERGSKVKKGGALALIDARQASLRAEEARTQLASAQTRSALAKTQCERTTKLFQSGALNRSEYDDSKAQCEGAELDVEAAAVRQRMASKNLADVVVRAPFDGVIADRLVSAGEYVQPDTKVATLVQLDPLRLELSVPEDALGNMREGAEVRFAVAAFPNQTFVGQVRFVGAAVRRATRDLLVEAVVPNHELRLRPGMFASANVVLGTVALPVVPASALQSDEQAGTDRVFVVERGRVQERLVHTGANSDGAVAIVDGVRAGERVVLSPAAGLRDGASVQD